MDNGEWMWAGWGGISISKHPWLGPIKHSTGTKEEKSTEPPRRWLQHWLKEIMIKNTYWRGWNQVIWHSRTMLPSIYKSCLSQQLPNHGYCIAWAPCNVGFPGGRIIVQAVMIKTSQNQDWRCQWTLQRAKELSETHSCGWVILRVTSQPLWRGACMMQKGEINPRTQTK